MASVLPPELTDRIVDFLWNDQGTLFSCALTSRGWLPASTFHLYAQINVKSKESLDGIIRASRSPHISASFKRSHTLNVRIPDYPTIEERKWSHRVPAVLPRLCPNITSLHLHNITFWKASTEPDLFTIGCSQWKRVTHLSLSRAGFRNLLQLQRLLRAFSALDSLDIFILTSDPSPTLATNGPSQAKDPALRRISFGAPMPRVSKWLLDGPTKESLRHLELNLELGSTDDAARWVDATADRLQHLSVFLNLGPWTEAHIVLLNIPKCVTLRSLEIATHKCDFDIVLRPLSSRSRIRSLRLITYSHDMQAWGTLRDTLSLPQFSELQDVSFRVTLDKVNTQDMFEKGLQEEGFGELASALKSRGVCVSSIYLPLVPA